MVNKVILVGRIGTHPEVRHTPAGNPVCNLSVATGEKWTDKSGEKKERTTWHRVQVWGKMAEICGKYLSKGSLVYVEGKIQNRQFQDKDGVTKFTTEVLADSVQFLSTKKAESSEPETDDQNFVASDSLGQGDIPPF